jgi:3',5'-cyclic-AMP phosphodiesterase
MILFQLTDIHIGFAHEDTLGIDVRNNFLQLLDTLTEQTFDLLVITGDLCYQTGQTVIYQWIKTELEKRQIPYTLIPGNHDDADLMRTCFDPAADEAPDAQWCYAEKPGQPPLVFLDTSSGVLPPAQCHFLQQYLEHHQRPICLFMHHPPLPMGVPFMDQNYPLRNSDALLPLLLAHPYPISIFCGHYHVEKSLRLHNIDVHITPSTFFQLNGQTTTFEIDHQHPGYRRIFWDGERLEHSVHYFL